ncbi:hypothetical protein DRP04_12550 [Archaeoglobales archaeon]|nr:MAG: hypothetical protein DRP04_12550 [Archaeoglobales archaeon]
MKEIAGIEREVHAIDPENLKILVECAEEHLSYYPVHDLLTERRQKLEEAEEKEKTFMESLARRLEEEFGELTDPVRATRDFVGENIPSQIYYCIYYKIKPHKYFEYKNDELWFRNTLIARGFNVKEFIIREIENRDNIKAVEEIKRLREKVSKISEEIKREIHKLILKIESGEPLIGKCRTCPEVTL